MNANTENTANTAAALVEVKDMYGKRFHVRADALAGDRQLMRLHDPRTGQPLRMSSDKWLSESVHLHRGNICEHPREGFQKVTIFGDSWMQCLTCRERVEADAKAILEAHDAQAVAA